MANDTTIATPAGPSSSSDGPGPLTGSTLIKSLKAPQDPPTPAGPSKIEIATRAWEDSTLVVPRKADVVRDWIVEAWSRGKPGPTNPILSADYHRLLVRVTPRCAAPAAAPLSLLGTYISSCKAAAEKAKETKYDLAQLAPAAAASFALLFNETKAEAWAEMWGVLVSALAVIPAGHPSAAALGPAVDLICGALVLSLPTSPNAKKIAAAAHAHLPAYAKTYIAHEFAPLTQLTSTLLFPVPTLQTVEPLKAALAPLATSSAEADLRPALALLPHLFDAFVSATLKHKYTLYGKSNSDRPVDVIVADRVRGAVIPALGSALELANKVEGGSVVLADAVWAARLRMWETLLQWGGYLETEERAGALVSAEAQRAAAALAAYGASEANATDEGLAGKILRTLDALERLDHARAGIDTVVIGWCLASPARTHAAARTLLASVLRFHQLTHSLSRFLELVCDAVGGLFDPALPAPALAAVYTLVAAGPVSDKAFVDDLRAAVKSTNLAGRRSAVWAGMLDDIGRRVRTALAAEDEEQVGGKRKRSAPGVADAPARLVGVLSRLAAVLLNAGARANAGDDEVEGAIGAVARAFVPDADNDNVENENNDKKKKHRKSDAARDVASDIVTAARLRVARAATLVGGECETGTQAAVAVAAVTGTPELRLEAFRFLVTHLALTAHGEGDSTERSAAVDAVLGLLSSTGAAAWSGRDATVSSASLAGACWTVLAQNGLGVLDATASATQLDTLAGLLVSLMSTTPDGDLHRLTPHAAAARLLRTAETWELISVRSALLRALSAKNAGTFAVLSCSPAAWLSKGARAALLEAAYGDKSGDKAAIRAWLARLAGSGILGPLDADKLDNVLKKAAGAEAETLALTQAALPHLIRSGLPTLLDNAASALKKNKDKEGDVRVRAVPLLMAALCALPLEKLAGDKDKLGALEAAARKALTPRAEAAVASTSEAAAADLEAYRVLTKYARWLGKEDAGDIGARLVSRLLRSESDPHLAVVALDLVPSDSTLAAFLVLSARHPTPALDGAFKAHARALSAGSYAEALGSLVRRCSAGSEAEVATALRAARILVSAPVEGSGKAIAGVLSRLLAAVDSAVHVPSVRVVGEALEFIAALVDERTGLVRSNDAAQIIATLTAALLPSSSASSSTSTPPTSTPTSSTATATSAACAPHLLALAVSPLLTFARHRADLVLAHMPAYVSCLSTALPLLQRARGRAGRKRLLASRPFWFASDPPAEADDPAAAHAALVARTLVAMCTARVQPQSQSQSQADNVEAKSLAGPLGKHAPAILVSYARAAADPWASLSARVRAELEPGLFAVCDVVTAGGRADGRGREGEGVGAPFGLEKDESEREVWADLWRAWGRRRYTGKG